MPNRIAVAGFLLTLILASHAAAWNALGHKVVAEIAWRQLKPEQRQAIVDTLRRHPRFDKDFAEKMTDDVLAGDKATQDRWIFQHAATWPDIIRGTEPENGMVWDWPVWHYVDFPIYLDPSDRTALADKLPFNRSAEYPTRIAKKEYNVMQAVAHCRRVLESRARADAKAIAYCWVFHLVGDIHQPLHSTALCSVGQFPEGDRGGNEIPLARGRNLHSLWDGLLGSRYYMRDVDRLAVELADRKRYGDVWESAAKETNVPKWVAESHAICKSKVYSTAILDAVRNTPVGQDLTPIELPDVYMREAGEAARRRVIAAGIRLGIMLGGNPRAQQAAEIEWEPFDVAPAALAPTKSRVRSAAPTPALDHWLNTSTKVRHNSSCRWYGNTKGGRYCSADDGKPCGQCGG